MQQETEDKGGQFKSGEYGVSANSKFLFMKWKRDFFGMNKMCIINQKETDKVEVPFWVFAQYLFLRVMNESISHGGKLRFDDDMPYSPVLLAETFGLDAELAKRAFSLFERYNLVKWDEEKSLIIPCAMANIGQQGAGSSTERSRKCRAAKKLRELGEKANGNGAQRGCNTTQRCSNVCNAKEKEIEKEEEKDKEEESPPNNPPQGGDSVDLSSYKNDSSGGDDQWEATNPNTNGSSGFAQQRNDPASQITREELAEWVKNEAPKTTMTITNADEDAFWNWLVAARFKNGKGRLITKWNVGKTIFYFIENRKKDSGRPKSVSATARDIMWQTTHLQQEGYEVRD